MKRWLSIIIPVVVLTGLIAWRLDQKKADIAAQASVRAARLTAPAVAPCPCAAPRHFSHIRGHRLSRRPVER